MLICVVAGDGAAESAAPAATGAGRDAGADAALSLPGHPAGRRRY